MNYRTFSQDDRPAIARKILGLIEKAESHDVPAQTITMLESFAKDSDESRTWKSIQLDTIRQYVRRRIK